MIRNVGKQSSPVRTGKLLTHTLLLLNVLASEPVQGGEGPVFAADTAITLTRSASALCRSGECWQGVWFVRMTTADASPMKGQGALKPYSVRYTEHDGRRDVRVELLSRGNDKQVIADVVRCSQDQA